MNELKPEDVMRALDICNAVEYNCEDCPYFGTTKGNEGCSQFLMRDALALLRDKDARIAMMVECIRRQDKELAENDAEIERLNKANQHFAELENGYIVTGYKNIRAEAITEFAERLKEAVKNIPWCDYHPVHNCIDQLAEKLKGETDEN
jgi:hypothetical protein